MGVPSKARRGRSERPARNIRSRHKPLDDGQLGVDQRDCKRCDDRWIEKEIDWDNAEVSKLASLMPFPPSINVRLAVSEARDEAHRAFYRKRRYEEALIGLVEARTDLQALSIVAGNEVAITFSAYMAMIFTRAILSSVYGVVNGGRDHEIALRTIPSDAFRSSLIGDGSRNTEGLSRPSLMRQVTLLESIIRDGSCMPEWLNECSQISRRGISSAYEIDTFVRSLVIFWEGVTGKLPPMNTSAHQVPNGFYAFLAAAGADVGLPASPSRRVREVVEGLRAEREAEARSKQRKADQREAAKASRTRKRRATIQDRK